MSVTSDLPAALAGVRRPGDFYTSGVFDWRAPALSVAGVGPVALPLLEAPAKQLIGAAELAPYGRREETVVDVAVRNSWQIDADRVEIAGARWSEALTGIVARVAEGLGVEGAVEAVFYKLLIYEPGGFFLDHRDTEKCPGMFGTLIIAPPGLHSGGELVIRHGEREARLDLKSSDPAEASFAAFYADCRHEVRPVQSGYRLVLVYNLRRQGEGRAPEPPIYDKEAMTIAAILAHWREEAAPEKIVLPLAHAYSPAELSFAALKGADQAAAKTLRKAASEAGCDLHLALLTIEESGAAEYTGYSSPRGRWGADEPELEAGEVFDRHASLGNWRSLSDESCDLPPLSFDEEDELSPPAAFDDLKPDTEYFGEATGNEGASFERTYRRAALVLWPSENFCAIVAGADIDDALTYLEARVARATSAEDRARESKLADAIAARLAEEQRTSRRAGELTPAARLLALCRRLDHAPGVARCFERMLPACGFEKQDVETLLEALSLVEHERRESLIETLCAGAAPSSFAACAKLLRRLAESSSAGHFRGAAVRLVAAMPPGTTDEPAWRARPPHPEEIADMLAALRRIDEGANGRGADRLLNDPKTYGFDAILVPALCLLAAQGELAAPGAAIERLRAACLGHLRARADEPLTPPPDWRRAAALGCKCRDCAEFSLFLDDPARKEFVLRAAESARSHLERTIHAANCDVNAKTLRQGRPYSLVCTKNQASYDRRVAQRKKDLENISILGN